MVVVEMDHRRKVGIELHVGMPTSKLSMADVFKPTLRTLHAIQPTMRAVGMRHRRALRT